VRHILLRRTEKKTPSGRSVHTYRGADKPLARPGKKQATATEDFDFHISYFIIIIAGILVLFIYITRLASNETFSPSNKIHREVGRAKDLSAPWYILAVIRRVVFHLMMLLLLRINHLTPNGHYMGRTAQLTSRCCILNIYLSNIRTEYFKHAA